MSVLTSRLACQTVIIDQPFVRARVVRSAQVRSGFRSGQVSRPVSQARAPPGQVGSGSGSGQADWLVVRRFGLGAPGQACRTRPGQPRRQTSFAIPAGQQQSGFWPSVRLRARARQLRQGLSGLSSLLPSVGLANRLLPGRQDLSGPGSGLPSGVSPGAPGPWLQGALSGFVVSQQTRLARQVRSGFCRPWNQARSDVRQPRRPDHHQTLPCPSDQVPSEARVRVRLPAQGHQTRLCC